MKLDLITPKQVKEIVKKEMSIFIKEIERIKRRILKLEMKHMDVRKQEDEE